MNGAKIARKAELETVIRDGIKTFREVGEALAEVKAEKLYADEFETFEEYAKEKWKIGQRRAYQLMDASEVTKNVCTIVQIPTESVARELSNLPKSLQVKVAKSVKKRIDRTPQKITSKLVRNEVHKIARGGLGAVALAERSKPKQAEIDLNLKPKMTPIARAQAASTVIEWWQTNQSRCLGYPAVPTAQVVQQIISLFQ